jgi:alpha-L-rhamnosidase
MRLAALLPALLVTSAAFADLRPSALRTEWLQDPLGIDSAKPRVSWRVVESDATLRGQKQTAYRVIAASSAELLAEDKGDLWDSAKVAESETLGIEYGGRPLTSGQAVFWKVRVWDKDGKESAWSESARWSVGLLNPEDWKAQWISFQDETPLHKDRKTLHLPPARHYLKRFTLRAEVKRATLYGTALGIAEWHLNSERVGDAYFEPGWSDYRERLHYRTHDVTKLVQKGPNALGAMVADGWYAGYLGYALLVGYGPNQSGRNIYGKTPALLGQLEVEYADGTRETIVTDPSWQTTDDGPIREADFLMGESFDARRRFPWTRPVPPTDAGDWKWSAAIPAQKNGSIKAKFFEPGVQKEVELGFQKPKRLVAYAAQPVRITEEIPAKKMTEPLPGTYIFDLGENIAGVIRLRVKGAAGTQVRIRHGEMLHKDGRLMTENLRKARATDTYTLRGDSNGETWQPRFTYHGFQFVEITGLAEKPGLDAVTGLVMSNDMPLTGTFACSDEVMTRFWRNTVRTQKANFLEVPTDCPQRDERLGWMGDAQIYARTASYNADVAAFFTKWVDDVREAQRDSGAYPDYAPYPYAHGAPGATHGTAWTDAGVIVPYTMWKVYGDTRMIDRHWESMVKFMDWRAKADPQLKGVKLGNTWGDWLNVNEETPIEYVDLCYHRISALLMAQMAGEFGRLNDAERFAKTAEAIQRSFDSQYVKPDGSLTIATQTAYVLALESRLIASPDGMKAAASRLCDRVAANDFRMATGFLGTKPLLLALTKGGQLDLAARLFQSRKFPSWGYEVEQGATSVWERWDSFTKEHGFEGANGKNNASMNSFSHYAFGAVMQWGYQTLAGIDTDGAGFRKLIIHPHVPSAASNPDGRPLEWVRAAYVHPRGRIESGWKREGDAVIYELTIPANTTATVVLPAAGKLTEGGAPIPQEWMLKQSPEGTRAVGIGAGSYRFELRP